MLTPEDLKMLETLFEKKLEPINQRLDGIEESLAEVRGATNYIAEWVEGLEKKVDRAM